MLLGLDVEHQRGQRPLQPGERPEQGHEAGAGQLGAAAEIHAEAGAQLVMLLGRKGEIALAAPAAQLLIGGLVPPVRHVLGQDVRQAGQLLVKRRLEALQALLRRRHRDLERRHLGHQGLGRATAAAQAANLLGERVALRLLLLQLGLQRPDRAVLGQQLGRHRRGTAARQSPVEDLRLIT